MFLQHLQHCTNKREQIHCQSEYSLSQEIIKQLVEDGVAPIFKLSSVAGKWVAVVAADFIGVTPAD